VCNRYKKNSGRVWKVNGLKQKREQVVRGVSGTASNVRNANRGSNPE